MSEFKSGQRVVVYGPGFCFGKLRGRADDRWVGIVRESVPEEPTMIVRSEDGGPATVYGVQVHKKQCRRLRQAMRLKNVA